MVESIEAAIDQGVKHFKAGVFHTMAVKVSNALDKLHADCVPILAAIEGTVPPEALESLMDDFAKQHESISEQISSKVGCQCARCCLQSPTSPFTLRFAFGEALLHL